MRVLKKKTFWLTIYAVLITGVFLYALFPGDWVRRVLENASQTSAWRLKVATVSPSLPWGLALGGATLAMADDPARAFVIAEKLDVQPRWWTAFFKRKQVALRGRAYGGTFDGIIGLVSLSGDRPPDNVRMRFEKIELAGVPLSSVLPLRGASGLLSGNLTYGFVTPQDPYPDGQASIRLDKGSYVLPEPFLGISRLDFERGELQARLQQGVLKIEKIELYGTAINCFLNGEITLAPDLSQSALNFKGVFEMTGPNKMKMNVTIAGTLANPVIRYI